MHGPITLEGLTLVIASGRHGRARDLIVAGDVYTVDAALVAGGVAIRGDRIVAVGTEAEVRERVGTAEVISSACIVPGFQDAHIHAAFAGRIRRHVNLDDLHEVEDYLERIRSHVQAHPDEPWVVGGGWYAPVFGVNGPHRRQLDAIVADRPVYLMNTDTHAAWVNSRALAASRGDPTRGAATTCATPTAAAGRLSGRTDATRSGRGLDGVGRVAPGGLRLGIAAAWQDAWCGPIC
jgi:predicted amidohydrolase YtcJ